MDLSRLFANLSPQGMGADQAKNRSIQVKHPGFRWYPKGLETTTRELNSKHEYRNPKQDRMK